MLKSIGVLAGALVLALPAHAQGGQATGGTYDMSDSASMPEGVRVPFAREEYERALLLAMPQEEATMFVHLVFDNPHPAGVNIMDGDLLLVAALSDDAAARVVKYRPRLAEQVRRIRADPEAFLADVRRGAGGS